MILKIDGIQKIFYSSINKILRVKSILLWGKNVKRTNGGGGRCYFRL